MRSIDGESFLPGFVGLNNLSATDYINVVVQALAHVRVLRDYFLRPEVSFLLSERNASWRSRSPPSLGVAAVGVCHVAMLGGCRVLSGEPLSRLCCVDQARSGAFFFFFRCLFFPILIAPLA